ncbi:hypothetical protein E1161_08760 [Saccharopolyspora aridisoli]|uniref:Uncharacterized protein n=1 Tax=Saccharopolyspora aridisoli TaxID=2530385 RepID=A0A4R4UYZ0_9PSEU|nr:hypothetical protein [Saccharopolyspora aridisoli]TDC94083.1 hypothetical protein E1161_08760 [Saccharopolyspora aridisoli]
MNFPQNPWQQGGHPQSGTPSGGFPQQQLGGYQPYSQNPFSAPPVPVHEMAVPQRPATVETAFWIAVVLPLLVTVLNVVSYLVLQGWVQDSIGGGSEDVTAEVTSAVNGVMMVFFVIVTIFYLILTGLWITFGFKLRAGRNWARVTLTIFAAFWAMSSTGTLASGGMATGLSDTEALPGSYYALSYVQGGLGVVGTVAFVVLVFTAKSNAYFDASNRQY